MVQLNLALLVIDCDYHVLKIQQVFALQLLQLKTNLFCLMGLIEPDPTTELLICFYPSRRLLLRVAARPRAAIGLHCRPRP